MKMGRTRTFKKPHHTRVDRESCISKPRNVKSTIAITSGILSKTVGDSRDDQSSNICEKRPAQLQRNHVKLATQQMTLAVKSLGMGIRGLSHNQNTGDEVSKSKAVQRMRNPREKKVDPVQVANSIRIPLPSDLVVVKGGAGKVRLKSGDTTGSRILANPRRSRVIRPSLKRDLARKVRVNTQNEKCAPEDIHTIKKSQSKPERSRNQFGVVQSMSIAISKVLSSHHPQRQTRNRKSKISNQSVAKAKHSRTATQTQTELTKKRRRSNRETNGLLHESSSESEDEFSDGQAPWDVEDVVESNDYSDDDGEKAAFVDHDSYSNCLRLPDHSLIEMNIDSEEEDDKIIDDPLSTNYPIGVKNEIKIEVDLNEEETNMEEYQTNEYTTPLGFGIEKAENSSVNSNGGVSLAADVDSKILITTENVVMLDPKTENLDEIHYLDIKNEPLTSEDLQTL